MAEHLYFLTSPLLDHTSFENRVLPASQRCTQHQNHVCNSDCFSPHNQGLTSLRPAQFPHPKASEDQLNNIELTHREARTWSDAAAYRTVQFFKWGTNFVTGYRNDPKDPVYRLNERKWFTRFIFLETIAAVPGMTAGMLRHFRSLRRMQRDHGW